jgi:hypothetical protein
MLTAGGLGHIISSSAWEDVMKVFKNIAGIVIILLGGLWILQGSNIIPGMAMSGSGEWLVIGAMLVIFAIGLLYQNNRPKTRIHLMPGDDLL